MYSVANILTTIRKNTGQLGELEAHINKSMQCTSDIASEIVEREQDGDQMNDKLSKLQNVMSNYIKLENSVIMFRSAIENLCTNMTEVSENAAEELKESYGRIQTSTPDTESHRHYKDLMAIIEEGRGGSNIEIPQTQEEVDDEDLVLTQAVSIPIDPFTKLTVTDPVRNKICKHVYEKNSILKHMESRGRAVRCPISGCSNTARITEAILEDDEELRRQIRRKTRAGMLTRL